MASALTTKRQHTTGWEASMHWFNFMTESQLPNVAGIMATDWKQHNYAGNTITTAMGVPQRR